MKTVALIGKGYWGAKMFDSIYNNPNFNIRYHLGNESRVKMLADEEVEAVFIATPIKTHAGLAFTCLSNNKHVYSAKPLAMDVKTMDLLIGVANANSRHISVDYTTTFSIHFDKLKRDIEDFGEIIYMGLYNGNWGRFNEYSVDWLYTSHMLAMLDSFKRLETLNFIFNGNEDISRVQFAGGDIFTSRKLKQRVFQMFFLCEGGNISYNPPKSSPSDLDMSIQHFHNVLTGKEESNIFMAREITKIISTKGGKL